MNTLDATLSTLLWLAGCGHFLVLCASFQVPARLNWRTDLAKLTPFNRKLMWTYGSFIAALIAGFGILTLALHAEMLRGDRAAVGLAWLIGLFWLKRIVVDYFVFTHDDWPQGRAFIVGHVLLTTLFVFLAGTYLTLAVRHSW